LGGAAIVTRKVLDLNNLDLKFKH
ncbi:MAG: hypothetical protein Q611_LSC00047G0001, partial [Leuconostoc sp. DORA_2]